MINLGKQEVALGKQNKIWELLAQRISKKFNFYQSPGLWLTIFGLLLLKVLLSGLEQG